MQTETEQGVCRFDDEGCATKSCTNSLPKQSVVSNLQNCLQRSRQIGSILSQHFGLDANLRLAKQRVCISAEMVIKTPPENFIAECTDLRIKMRVDDL